MQTYLHHISHRDVSKHIDSSLLGWCWVSTKHAITVPAPSQNRPRTVPGPSQDCPRTVPAPSQHLCPNPVLNLSTIKHTSTKSASSKHELRIISMHLVISHDVVRNKILHLAAFL